MANVEKFLKRIILLFIGAFRPGKKIPLNQLPVNLFKRILIIRQHDQLGDLLITTPAIRAVRKRFPNAHLAVVVREYTASMMWENPNVNEVIVFYEQLSRWNWQKLKIFWTNLRKDGGYDCAIVLNTISRSLSSDIIAVLSKAKYIVGPNHLSLDPDIPEKIYNVLTPRSRKYQTEIEHNLDIVRAIGVLPDGTEYDLELDDNEKLEGERTLYALGIQRRGQMLIGVHFGTLDLTRRFPLPKLGIVIDWMKKQYNCDVIVLVGPNEVELREELFNNVNEEIYSAPVMPLRVVAAFIKNLDLFLCNDTGTLHIASAMRVPTVSFHGPNDPEIWKPPHPRHIAVRAEDKKITSITVEQVKEAVSQSIQNYVRAKTQSR